MPTSRATAGVVECDAARAVRPEEHAEAEERDQCRQCRLRGAERERHARREHGADGEHGQPDGHAGHRARVPVHRRFARAPRRVAGRRATDRDPALPGGVGGELAARGRDVAAAGQAHRRGKACGVEHGLERGDPLARCAVVHAGRVVRDQVDLEDPRLEQLRELSRVRRASRSRGRASRTRRTPCACAARSSVRHSASTSSSG